MIVIAMVIVFGAYLSLMDWISFDADLRFVAGRSTVDTADWGRSGRSTGTCKRVKEIDE